MRRLKSRASLATPLKEQILACETKARLEDLYLPYKKRRKTKADIAREAGLEELTDKLIADPNAAPEELAQAFTTEGFEDTKGTRRRPRHLGGSLRARRGSGG